jgi:hypothetical protein
VVATIRALQRHGPILQILVLTATYDERLIAGAMTAEAAGHVLRPGGMEELLGAIRSAQAGRLVDWEATPGSEQRQLFQISSRQDGVTCQWLRRWSCAAEPRLRCKTDVKCHGRLYYSCPVRAAAFKLAAGRS